MNLLRNNRNRARNETDGGTLTRFRGEMDNLIERFMRDPWGSITGTGREAWIAPRLDVAEDENEITLRVELPGVKPEDIQIDVTGDVLTLRGEKSCQKDEKGRDFHYCETEYGTFSRTVQLPVSVDPDRVDAAYRDGILTITLTKRPDARPKRIPVRGADPAAGSGQPVVNTGGPQSQDTGVE
jgi:HSP20 family protein